jgi:predicted nucleic acid-binding protein
VIVHPSRHAVKGSVAPGELGQREELAERSVLVINPIVYAEGSIGLERIEDLDAVLPTAAFRREPLPWEAAFLAGKWFLRYRRSRGAKPSPLPDFFIGAHAAVRGMSLLTRDPHHCRTYFPRVPLITPQARIRAPSSAGS